MAVAVLCAILRLILAMVEESRTFLLVSDAHFVVSRKIAGTVNGRELRGLAAGPPFLESEINQRVAFAVTMTYGQTIKGWWRSRT